MCKDDTCPKKSTCYRFMAESLGDFQTYFLKSPRKGNDCKYYWKSEN